MATGEFLIFLGVFFLFFFSPRGGGGGRRETDYPLGNPKCLHLYSRMGFPIIVQK